MATANPCQCIYYDTPSAGEYIYYTVLHSVYCSCVLNDTFKSQKTGFEPAGCPGLFCVESAHPLHAYMTSLLFSRYLDFL